MNFPTKEPEKDIPTVERPLAPRLYSKRLILIFAILFSTIFAAALLVSNLRHLKKVVAAVWVSLFAVGYIILTAVVMQVYQLSPSLTVVANVIGAALLNEYFWNKYIGAEVEFEKKGWMKPTAISIVIVGILFFMMMGMQ